MGKTVLFSPIGTTDPIRDCYDGGMLHIARHFRPDKIYLYLSKEMLDYHNLDDRYRRTLALLGEALDHCFEVEIVPRPDLTNPHLWDDFYYDFESLLNAIAEEKPDRILLNTSSGTPAMKAALQTIAAMSDHLYTPVQVASPEKGSNKSPGNHKDYNTELAWEQNIDNTPHGKNRCSVSRSENLKAKLKRELLFSHLDAYDYNAALRVAQGMGDFIKPETVQMLEAAKDRLALKFPQVSKRLDELGLTFFKRKPEHEKLLEAVLWLRVKEKRGEYVDFIRGITPVVTELFRFCLLYRCGIDIEALCESDNSVTGNGNYLRRNTLNEKAPDVLQILDKYYNGFEDSYISSANMSVLIKARAENESLCELADILNEIDGKKIRHIAAHTLTAVTENYVKKQTGYTCGGILGLIKKMLTESGIHVAKDSWLAYDKMNERIKESFKLN